MAMKNHSTGNGIIVLSDKFHEEQIRSTKGGYPINPTIPKVLFGLAIERVMGTFRALIERLHSDGQRNKSSRPESKAREAACDGNSCGNKGKKRDRNVHCTQGRKQWWHLRRKWQG